MVGVAEAGRRVASQWTGRLHSLPILALSVHSACNCRCVMCDIWKANADKREMSLGELDRHVADIRRLHVQRVMLTGGEPLLHSNLWALCDRLQEQGIRVTLVTTGLLIATHAAAIARSVDDVVVSIDGPPDVHDAIRRVRGGFDRIALGLAALRDQTEPPRVIARSVVQRDNFRVLGDTIEAVRALPLDGLSFLAADVTSTAFNRATPWDSTRQADVALQPGDLDAYAATIREVETRCRGALRGFVKGGARSLGAFTATTRRSRERRHSPPSRATRHGDPRSSIRTVRSGPVSSTRLIQPLLTAASRPTLNGPSAVAFRRSLLTDANDTCRRCVCSLSMPTWADA